MSFAGHVFDMIRRNKEDRDNLRRLRQQAKGTPRLHTTPHRPSISLEEFEEIQQQTKAREIEEQRYYSRMWVRIALVGLAILLLLLIVSKLGA